MIQERVESPKFVVTLDGMMKEEEMQLDADLEEVPCSRECDIPRNVVRVKPQMPQTQLNIGGKKVNVRVCPVKQLLASHLCHLFISSLDGMQIQL